MGTTPDGRPIPPPHADERAMLESWLEFHRATLALKCAGLDDRQLRLASVAPSAMTPLGLVQHLTVVERNWFQRVFAGRDVPLGHSPGTDGFALDPDRDADEVLTAWRAEVARSRATIAAASLDDSRALPEQRVALVGSREVSLRWILVHLIEEYARHNGHADLLRERIDGATGA
ncbi:DinB family protein [Streptomyces celluloflavus]|uniref:DinB family protein n=1 Tax=Streptomyces celluloflavus TaxID=58344 RepID=UPI0036DD0639